MKKYRYLMKTSFIIVVLADTDEEAMDLASGSVIGDPEIIIVEKLPLPLKED